MADKTEKKKKKSKPKAEAAAPIVIDEGRGLVFDTEDDVINHFEKEILFLEKEYHDHRREADTSLDEIENLDENLTELLQEPDEVWLSMDVVSGIPLGTFIGYFETEDETDGEDEAAAEQTNFYYIALTYFVDNIPKFVFMHFATTELEVIHKYQRGEKIYDRNNMQVQSDDEAVDALTEGNELAVGLYRAMLKLRSATDIPESEFEDFLQHREDSIQEPDEIWKKTDSEGRVLVSFIKSLEDAGDVKYVVVTMEDEASESQYLLFSFPTKDSNLVDRYRQGESLDTVSYTREESH